MPDRSSTGTAAACPGIEALDELVARVRYAIRPGVRFLLGIAGSPGSGKTTLAKALVKRINQQTARAAACLPMDGFHLANSTLTRLGLRDRKGAVETFDGWGLAAMLDRVRTETEHTVYTPSFKRTVDEAVAGEIAIEPSVQIVLVEGNYLLMTPEPWNRVRASLDAVWFCATPPAEREARLIDRHTRHGRTFDAAVEWVRQVDGKNAEMIETTAGRADLLVSGITGRVLS